MERMSNGTTDLITPLLHKKLKQKMTRFVSFYGRALLVRMIGYQNLVHTLKSEGLPMGPNITRYNYGRFR